MRAFVTGGAGFIGSTLVDRLLAEGHRVDVIDDLSRGSMANLGDARRDPDHDLHFDRLDVAAPAVIDVIGRRRPDVIYHLAAGPSGQAALDDPVADAITTVVGSLRILEAARRAGVRKVIIAVPAETLYADEPRSLPSRESSVIQPLDAHAVGKDAILRYLTVYRERHDLEYTALALSSVYGPRQEAGSASVLGMVRDHLAGEAVTLSGDGTETRDHVYVDDVVDALARAADRGSGLLINVGTGVETSAVDLVGLIARETGADVPVRRAPSAPGTPSRRCVDPGRAGIHLGWKPWTTLPAGIAGLVAWARANAPI